MDSNLYENTLYGEVRSVPGKGYRAYYPNPLPQSIDMAHDTVMRLADAEAALGRLAGAGRMLPHSHLLIRPYLLKEALSSARIEGTQASLLGVLEAEAEKQKNDPDIEEVLNYMLAMEEGLSQLGRLPFSLRLVRSMHAVLLRGVRGRERQPGEVRVSQNWIGPPGSTLETASFIPPPPGELASLLSDWERFVHENRAMSVLVQSGLLHYQFETIHPFLDGNGRMGRLLIVFHLVLRDRLPEPLLYLSSYFERRRDDYYTGLQGVRERGDMNAWLQFYLEGVETQANDAVRRAERLIDLREKYRARVTASTRGQVVILVDSLIANPITNGHRVEARLGVKRPTSLRMLGLLEELGILTEIKPGPRRQRRFVAKEVLEILEEDMIREPPIT